MGIFSSRYITQVGTSTTRAIEDDALPDAVKLGLTKAIFDDDQSADIPDYVMNELSGSLGVRANRMYRAAKNSGYVHGLPNDTLQSSTAAQPIVKQVLEAIEGSPVTIQYAHISAPNTQHLAWMSIITAFGYNPNDNTLSTLPNMDSGTYYLDDLIINLPASKAGQLLQSSLAQWGPAARSGFSPTRGNSQITGLLAPTPFNLEADVQQEQAQVEMAYRPGEQYLAERVTFYTNVMALDDKEDYVHARYVVNGVIKYWLYKIGTGTYPALDTVFAEPAATNGTYFPFIYYRYNKQSELDDPNTAAYIDSDKLTGKMGIDYATIGNAINDNPDIADVEQAMMLFAVPPETDNDIENRYLYDYFNRFYSELPEQFETPDQTTIQNVFDGLQELTVHSQIIKDQRFKMILRNQGIYKQRRVGKVGVPGTHTSGTTEENITKTYVINGVSTDKVFPVKTHWYRKQVGRLHYEEIKVVNLEMLYYVLDEYTTTSDETENILLIPLDYTITNEYSSKDREELYSRSLHYVFNSVVVAKVKWYQTRIFRDLLLIVAVILTIYSFGSDGGSLIAAIAAGSSAAVAAAVYVIIVRILTGLVLQYVFKLFAKEVGAEFALVLSLVLTIYAVGSGIRTGSIENAPWASEMLQLANGLTSGVEAYTEDLLEDLEQEYADFEDYKEEQTALLEERSELLSDNNKLSPLIIFGESPGEFFDRTTHSGNIGVLALSTTSSYVDIALTLPKLNESVTELTGEINDG